MTKGTDGAKTKLGIIGSGGRGGMLLGNLLGMDDVEIVAIAEIRADRLQLSLDYVEESGRARPDGYSNHMELLERDDIEGVIIASGWIKHIELSIAAMKAGKYVGVEVGGASSIDECWHLVRTSEETGMPCMMLENCCYGRNEMAMLKIVKEKVFGEIIHCQGGYEHDLREELGWGKENDHYRIHNYINRNGELYPTHALGPIAKILGINRGNRFINLTSMSSKSRGLHNWVEDNHGEDHPMRKIDFAQGDIVTTMIKCAHGETIFLIHDTTLPRPYSRGLRIQGTKGLWMEDNNSIYIEGKSPEHEWESFEDYKDQYLHPLWKEYIKEGVREGHDGMDHLCLRAFVESVKRKIAPPIDVYDTAAWMAVTALSEQSIAQGSNSVGFPDFTDGKWINRPSSPISKYSLDDIHEEMF